MLTYLSAVLPDTSWPFWPHFWLLSVSVVASFAVGAGIIFESAEYSASVHRVATWLVLGGIAVESLCTIVLFVFDEDISRDQQSKIEAQQATIISLEKRLAPRHLIDKEKFVARLKQFSGTKFAMSAASAAEPTHLAVEIGDALTSAGWTWINWPLGGMATRPQMRPEMGIDAMAGIETHIFDDSKKPIAGQLFLAMGDTGFDDHWIILPTPENPHAADAVIIIVGSKE
jgi:hypothetical protein